MHYLSTNFLMDLIALLPFPHIIKLPYHNESLFFLLKIVRLGRGLKLMSVKHIVAAIKRCNNQYIENLILNHKDLAEDQLTDRNKITLVTLLNLCFKTIRITVITLNISYFVGILWLVITRTIESNNDEEVHGEDVTTVANLFGVELDINVEEYFLHYFNAIDKAHYEQAIISVYFAFTTLSTVGLGDLHPRSDYERIIGAMILLWGVIFFTYCMGKFIDMINQIQLFYKTYEEDDDLCKFFGLLEHFNLHKPMDIKIKRNMEHFFEYKWQNNKC